MKRFVQANYRNKKVGLVDWECTQYVYSVQCSVYRYSFAHFFLLQEKKYFTLSFFLSFFRSFFLSFFLETFVQIRFLFDRNSKVVNG